MADSLNSINLTDVSRPILEAEIERLIALLDTLDPDPYIEDTADDEPWLGAPDARQGSWSGLYLEDNDDREEDDCDREPCCEDEGAQCDDEGANDSDAENDEHGPLMGRGLSFSERQEATAEIVATHTELRSVMKRKGRTPVSPLRVYVGAIWK